MNGDEAADRVNALADAYIDAYLAAFPHHATLLGVPNADHARLPDISLEARGLWEAAEDATVASLGMIEASDLAPDSAAATTHAFLSAVLESTIAYRQCRMELWSVSPTFNGWPSELALLAKSQPVETAAQQEAATQRFAELPRYVAQEIANLEEGLGRGYSAPRHNVRSVIQQMDALLAAPAEESPFVAIAPADSPTFREELLRIELGRIRPALSRYREFLSETYLPAARETIGISAHPRGTEAYRGAVRYWATLDMSADEIHETGLEQVDRIRAEMREVAERSFETDDVNALLAALRTESRYLLTGVDEMLLITEAAIERARRSLARWFGRVPAAKLAIELVPAFQQASAPAGFYSNPAEDSSRPGVYYVNPHVADRQPRADIETTAFHETYPGHHLQVSIALERTDLHRVCRYLFLSGFGEGWALYAERLAHEMGLFSSDLDRMGLLSAEAHRAARLVVDPGLHVFGWSRVRAIEYLLANTALSPTKAAAEVDRYIAVPAQATSYMLGGLEMRRLRRQAEEALGSDFDVRAFHDLLLEDGALPLDVLRAKMRRRLDTVHRGSEKEGE